MLVRRVWDGRVSINLCRIGVIGEFATVLKVLQALGLRLQVVPIIEKSLINNPTDLKEGVGCRKNK
ncbi:hypothetical protein MICCA_3290002 [Microcystis aeruginosa PCC 9432]|uniref:Uncharacterized protein n=2 Tax=Microcystis aeruginosa TaxID=1126 RepID=A0A822LC83_MICAE|nr:hypothetical protein MICCA_3290002 [Microcystis aeruginosa PCC 9432]CCI09385.1 hypothetical protein MICAD_50027 [Microcystis aeruginosa PCC 7941]CCI22614.1 hypothetical protein MICAG_1820017 [Microcystis aeruginosa PCC 9808]